VIVPALALRRLVEIRDKAREKVEGARGLWSPEAVFQAESDLEALSYAVDVVAAQVDGAPVSA
jgi:hypothetical protein